MHYVPMQSRRGEVLPHVFKIPQEIVPLGLGLVSQEVGLTEDSSLLETVEGGTRGLAAGATRVGVGLVAIIRAGTSGVGARVTTWASEVGA